MKKTNLKSSQNTGQENCSQTSFSILLMTKKITLRHLSLYYSKSRKLLLTLNSTKVQKYYQGQENYSESSFSVLPKVKKIALIPVFFPTPRQNNYFKFSELLKTKKTVSIFVYTTWSRKLLSDHFLCTIKGQENYSHTSFFVLLKVKKIIPKV